MTDICRSTRLLIASVGTALLAAGLVGCAPESFLVRTDPGLYPVFQSTVVDYVNRCDPDDPTAVRVSAPEGTTVSVAGRAPRGGSYTVQVDQEVNERFTLVVTRGGVSTTHHVRCLPLDFPQWSAERTGTPEARFYSTVLIEGFEPNIPVIFDTNGVPVWWAERQPTFLLTPLPNGNLVTLPYLGGMIERRLDGTPVRVLNTRGATSDFHDVLLLPNGNYVLATIDQRPCDLALWGQPASTCVFHDFQEMTPAGEVVWNWRPEEDIPITETSVKWRDTVDPMLGVADPYHYNSVEWTGDGFIISFRHLDAVYKIDHATRDVVWKLGGSPRSESLRVLDDPVFSAGGSISGQHDARMSGGTLTLFDNGSNVDRAPRSVAYRIDEGARTARMIRQVTDRIAPASMCCGSSRVLPGGNVVTGWGGTPWITEHRPDGKRVFRLNANFVYRAIPILDGGYTRDELRDGMDAQFEGSVPAAHAVRVDPPGSAEQGQLGDLGFRLGR